MTIKQIQAALILLGYSPGNPDNQLGPMTKSAVACFQRDHGLPDDGVPGNAAVAAIRAALAEFAGEEQAEEIAPDIDEIVIPYPCVDGYYIIPKGANVPVSKNFRSSEWDCHGVGCCKETRIAVSSIRNVQGIRDRAKRPVTITSGYRCPIHNPAVGGSSRSYHVTGDATDIVVDGWTPRQTAQDAEAHGITGIGLYETAGDGHFCHIDQRPYKSFWYGQAQVYRSTFF